MKKGVSPQGFNAGVQTRSPSALLAPPALTSGSRLCTSTLRRVKARRVESIENSVFVLVFLLACFCLGRAFQCLRCFIVCSSCLCGFGLAPRGGGGGSSVFATSSPSKDSKSVLELSFRICGTSSRKAFWSVWCFLMFN